LVLPLIESTTVVGVLELLASEPDAFPERSVHEVIQLLASAVASQAVEAAHIAAGQLNQTGTDGGYAKVRRFSRIASAALILTGVVYAFWVHQSKVRVFQQKAFQLSPAQARINKGRLTAPTRLRLPAEHTDLTRGTLAGVTTKNFRAAASKGDAKAAYVLGTAYEEGNGVPQDYKQAMDWFLRAAIRGDARAQWKLGLGYLKAFGREEDDRQAAEWFKRAANQGNVSAQLVLSRLYFTNRGVPLDYVRAYTWATIAAQASNIDEQLLTSIKVHMTPEQIQDAHRRVSLWNAWIHRTAMRSLHSRNVG
jgi:TPR repeat protein